MHVVDYSCVIVVTVEMASEYFYLIFKGKYRFSVSNHLLFFCCAISGEEPEYFSAEAGEPQLSAQRAIDGSRAIGC
jgi:hypothetical protein